ncbi:unnamed protein product [Haemonchus placei]|uniref:TonB_C domain-containing protein n=1 Tax=Haemonchus placei TaxID=6290 RepID=A0A0N4WWA1_HAEPC|nr:unnamed protein product [Haemonchus placei]
MVLKGIVYSERYTVSVRINILDGQYHAADAVVLKSLEDSWTDGQTNQPSVCLFVCPSDGRPPPERSERDGYIA